MIIFSIIVMYSYCCSVCLVSRILKNTYFIKNFPVDTFQWLLTNVTHGIGKTILRNLNYVQCLKITPMEKARFMTQWNIAPIEKALWPIWSVSSQFIALMEKAWFYETLFFEVITVIVKDEKMQYKIYTISIKISFMHYMKWTRVMLPVVFEEFQMVFVFLIFFFLFTIIVNW